MSIYAWPAASWVALGLALVAVQLVPIPSGLMGLLAPAAHSIHHPNVPAAREALGSGWHPISIEPFLTEAELLRLGALAAAFFLASQLFSHRREIRLAGYTMVATGVVLSFFAVYQQAHWGSVLYGRYPVPSATPFGPFVNHNHFAGFVEMCALVALGGAIGHLRRLSLAPIILLGGSASIMAVALVLSGSRGGLLAAAAGAVCLGALVLRRSSRASAAILAAWGGAVLFMLLLAAPRSVFDRIGSIASPGEDLSIEFKMQLWRDSLGLAKRSPWVGTGLGTYVAAIPAYRTDRDETRAEYAESDWIQHACETGLAGWAILAGFIIAVMRRSRRKLLEEQGLGRTRGLWIGMGAGAFALLVHGIFDFNTRIPSNGLLLAVLLGLLVSAHAKKAKPLPSTAARRFVPALLVLALAATAAWRSATIGFSRQIMREVNLELAEPEVFPQIAGRLAEARAFAPNNPEVALKTGLLYNEEAYRSADAARYRDLRFTQAHSSFLEAVQLAPARGRHWFELAWTEGNLRRDDVADPLFRYALYLEPAWSRLRADYALFLASRGQVEEALGQLEIGRKLKPGLTPYDAVSIIGPYVKDDPAILRRASGEGTKAEQAVSRYLSEQ